MIRRVETKAIFSGRYKEAKKLTGQVLSLEMDLQFKTEMYKLCYFAMLCTLQNSSMDWLCPGIV